MANMVNQEVTEAERPEESIIFEGFPEEMEASKTEAAEAECRRFKAECRRFTPECKRFKAECRRFTPEPPCYANTPLVDGTPAPSSWATAARMATAVALNADSAL
eukprot:scaffold361_cov248-Pinguiococcus_pyrenoidosus.AAC.26